MCVVFTLVRCYSWFHTCALLFVCVVIRGDWGGFARMRCYSCVKKAEDMLQVIRFGFRATSHKESRGYAKVVQRLTT